MTRRERAILSHLLPAIFWTLAIGGSLIPLAFAIPRYAWGYVPIALVLFCIVILGHIRRHTTSAEQCFVVALLLGIASYWLPTVVFLIVPAWAYLIYINVFRFQSITATLLGGAVVAIWAAIFIHFGWIANPWAEFFAPKNAWGWIPTGAILLAWLASTIVRQILHER